MEDNSLWILYTFNSLHGLKKGYMKTQHSGNELLHCAMSERNGPIRAEYVNDVLNFCLVRD